MVTINTNLNSLKVQRHLTSSTNALNTCIERLSTGFRINCAKDDAAGYAIATSMETKLSSLEVVQDNTSQGIALLNTAEGALSNIQSLLQRIRDLSIEALNDTYSDENRAAMQKEAELLLEEVSRIRGNTEYNGLQILGGFVEENCYPTVTTSSSYTPPVATTMTSPSLMTAPKMTMAPMMVASPPLTGAGSPITGTFDLSASEKNKKVTIDGVEYTFSNRNSTARSVSYSKDTTTGELTFYCNYVEIRGQLDTAHNMYIRGDYNYVYGGDLNDTINVTGQRNNLYGGNGNDTMDAIGDQSTILYNYLYGGNGDDTLSGGYATYLYGESGSDTLNGREYNMEMIGGDGNDVININGNQLSSYIFNGGNGNDIFNINVNSWYAVNINGEGDDDTFNIYSKLNSNTIINGGEGTNNVVVQPGGDTNGATLVNVVGGNAFEISFAAYETKNLTIDGKSYEITNGWQAQKLVYRIESGNINFSTSSNSKPITIKGDENISHNVTLSSGYITFYGGNLLDTITSSGVYVNIYGMGGDDIITTNNNSYVNGGDGNDTIYASSYVILNGANGNDTIYIRGNSTSIMGGDGDDNIIIQHTCTGLSIDGGSGNNTITGLGGTELLSGFGVLDNATPVYLNPNEEKTVTINNRTYTVKNRQSTDNQVLYSFNELTEEIIFSGNQIDVTGDKTKQNNVYVKGYTSRYYGSDLGDTVKIGIYYNNIYTGSGNDNITVDSVSASVVINDTGGDNTFNLNKGSTVTTGNGNNTININSTGCTINGGTGIDTYYINQQANIMDAGGNNVYYVNTSNSTITGGQDNDTFYINGANNSILGAAGNDYFIIDGTGGMVDGGTGTNNYIDNSGGTTVINHADPDPYGGVLSFTSVGETKTVTIESNIYTVTNTNASGTSHATNTLRYYYNPNTDTVTLEGSDLTVSAPADKVSNMNIRGNNNTINGSNLNDKIKIESGTNNIINGLDGNDTITMETADNAINAGNGNDTLILNASTTKNVVSGSGINTITLNSDNNTHLDLSSGTNTVRGTSSGNTITLTNNNNDILLTGANNTVTGTNGNNSVTLIGDNSSVTLQNGNNIIKLQGNNSNAVSGNGNSNISIWGDDSSITTGNGNSTLLLQGNGGEINAGDNISKITLSGNNSNITAGDNVSGIIITGNGGTINSGDNLSSLAVTGNSNNIEFGNADTNISIKGNENVLDMDDGNNSITISGNQNTFESGTGTKSLKTTGNLNNITLAGQTTAEITGDENIITTGNEADNIEFKGNENTIHTQGGEDTVTFKGDNNEIYTGDDNDIVTVKSGNDNFVDGEGGPKNYVYDNAENTEVINAIKLKVEPFKLNLKIDIGSSENSVISTEISFNTKGLSIDFSSRDSILDNLNDIDELMDSVTKQLTSIGAVQNRLESAQEAQSIKIANLTSSLSVVKDADIAQVSAEFVRNQILQQASATLLATANQAPGIALQLI